MASIKQYSDTRAEKMAFLPKEVLFHLLKHLGVAILCEYASATAPFVRSSTKF